MGSRIILYPLFFFATLLILGGFGNSEAEGSSLARLGRQRHTLVQHSNRDHFSSNEYYPVFSNIERNSRHKQRTNRVRSPLNSKNCPGGMTYDYFTRLCRWRNELDS